MELLPGGWLAERADEAEIPADPVADAASLSGIQREALELLEWGRLGEHVAGFASTTAGRRLCRELPLAPSLEASRQLLAQTTELLALDGVLEGGLSFQGVADLSRTVQLCAKGGVASADELLDVATTLAAARRLRRQIDDPELRPTTTALVDELRTLPELEQRLRFCIEDGGRVADRASPPWPNCAARSAPLARSAAID